MQAGSHVIVLEQSSACPVQILSIVPYKEMITIAQYKLMF